MDVKEHHTRVLPDGTTPPMDLDTDFKHRIVLHAEGDEDPQAMVPEAAGAEGGVSLPKLGEKFCANPVMGTGSVSIGFGLPPGRTLTPGLGLGYDSSGENGPFGLGWALSVPYFTRATTRPHLDPDGGNKGRGVPTYDDAAESDVFIFSDAAELVKVAGGKGQEGFAVTRYRPRIESGFVRIERWDKGGVSHWRVTSRDNVTSVFGLSPAAQVASPDHETHVFRWNLQAQFDALGNTVVYRYTTDEEAEPGHGPGAQTYLTQILYANRTPFDGDVDALIEATPDAFLFEVLLDWRGSPSKGVEPSDVVASWAVRPDAFSYGRAGFEVRTRRLCRGVRVIHRLLGTEHKPTLVSRTELSYDEDPVATRLVSVQRFGVAEDGKEQGIPARTFEYSARSLGAKTRTIPAEGLDGLDLSQPLTDAEVLDLHGTAQAGLLVRQLGKFIWRRWVDAATYGAAEELQFGASASTSDDPHRQRFMDLDLDGRPALVELGPSGGEVWERNRDNDGWMAGRALPSVPPEAQRDKETGFPRVVWGDLDGDGRTDALVVEAEGGAPVWWRFEGLERGWEPQDAPPQDMLDEEAAALLGTRGEVFVLADVTGDGLSDLLRLADDEIAVWPSLGHGRFGSKRVLGTLGTLPKTKDGDVDATRFRLLDVDGTGGVDVLVLGDSSATLWLNESGNRLVAGPSFSVPHPDDLALSSLARLDGRGTASFAYAKAEAGAEITVVDFVPGDAGAVRPGLLQRDENGMGLRTTVRYEPSTSFLPAPPERPWLTRLPHSMAVVTSVEHEDLVAGVRFASNLRYAHGCWDGAEREFRGFGFVEQEDAEDFEALATKGSALQSVERAHFSPPIRTRSWFHTGVDAAGTPLADAYRAEYSTYDPHVAALRPDASGPEQTRALKGLVLHTESYALPLPLPEGASQEERDAAVAKASRPFAVTEHGYRVAHEFESAGGPHPSVFVLGEQTLSYAYARKPTPDPRLTQSAALKVDAHGNVLKSIDVAYPRRTSVPEPIPPDGPVTPPEPPEPSKGVRARLVGFMFDESKNFILPSARAGLRGLAEVYRDHEGAELVVVGHTDRVGQRADNDALSRSRAASVAAFLRDDVDAWLDMYEPSVGWPAQWGDVEDAHMLGALGYPSVEGFQGAHGLPPGPLDRAQRERLVREYMGLDGTSLPPGVTVHVVGAGEHYPEVDTADGVDEPRNRRVDIFFFDKAIEPAVPGDLLGEGGEVYDAWLAAMDRTVDVGIETGDIDDPSGPEDIDWGGPEPFDPDLAKSDAPTDDPQLRTEIALHEVRVFNEDLPDHYRVGALLESLSRTVEGQSGDPTAPFAVAALQAMSGSQVLSRARTYYFDDRVDARLEGAVGKTGLVQSGEQAAFSAEQFEAAFGGDGTAAQKLADSKYVASEGLYWVPSGTTEHLSPDGFFLVQRIVDPFGQGSSIRYDEDHYFAVSTTDAKHNTVKTAYDPRALAPREVEDANGAKAHTRYDALGLPSKVWRTGVIDEGGSESAPAVVYEYDFSAFAAGRGPASRKASVVFDHARLHRSARRKRSGGVQTSAAYFSGGGGLLQAKVLDTSGKWRTSSQPTLNNKGLPVRVFDPCLTGRGYTPARGRLSHSIDYDALGQPVRTAYADGTAERIEYDLWSTTSFDRNDTAQAEGWTLGSGDAAADEAANAAIGRDANTPTHTRLGVLGRPVAVFEQLRDDEVHRQHVTRTHYDLAGNAFEVIDARGNVAEKRRFGLGGLVLQTRSVDANVSATLPDIDGGHLYSRRGPVGQGSGFHSSYDELRRPVTDFVQPDGSAAIAVKHRVWVDTPDPSSGAEAPPGAGEYHRGRLLRVYDGGGVLNFRHYDFDGNPIETERVLPADPATRPDWTALVGLESVADLDAAAASLLEDPEERAFTTKREYDAMGRAVRVENPTGVQFETGAVNDLEYRVEGLPSKARRAPKPADPDEPKFEVVHEVEDYDELGRATKVRRGKAVTRYHYDEQTQRLQSLVTKAAGKTLQSLHYTRDPVGNILHIRDDAQRDVTTGGEVVLAHQHFRYDSLYRLIEARGREHHGQVAGGPTPNGAAPLRAPAPNDVQAVRNYTQHYRYDATGNLLKLRHQLAPRHSAESWTRRCHYSEVGNRLRGTSLGKKPTPELHPHDAFGRFTAMPHLDALGWDESDQLRGASRGTMSLHLQYVDGSRIRKTVEKGGTTEERVYLGCVEFFRKSAGGTLKEATTTEHVGGGLLVETKTVRDGKDVASPKPLFRYQLGNHLGSVSLEVDEDGGVISYEEFHPYGTTSYRAVRSDVDVEVNRYRFTGMERDEETGLSQHGARYYACWLGRWCSADPIGLGGGINRYAYCRGSPVTLRDTDGMAPEDLSIAQGSDLEDKLIERDPGGGFRARDYTAAEIEEGRRAVKAGNAERAKQAIQRSSNVGPHSSGVDAPPVEEWYPEVDVVPTWTLLFPPVGVAALTTQGILNAPRHADLAGQHEGRAQVTGDPDEHLKALGYFTLAFLELSPFTMLGRLGGTTQGVRGAASVSGELNVAASSADDFLGDARMIVSRSKPKIQVGPAVEASATSAQGLPRGTLSYIRDIEAQTGRAVHASQRRRLAHALRGRRFTKLSPGEVRAHRRSFNKVRAREIEKWEVQTGQAWPRYSAPVLDKSGIPYRNVGDYYDAHHIIENSFGGPHKWWNLHPAATPGQHQGGIHRGGGPASRLFE